MNSIKLSIGLLVIATFPSFAQTYDWGLKSASLEENMTEAQVRSAVGYRPNKVSLETCGAKSEHGSWTCKIYIFGDSLNELRVLFRRSNEEWVVNSWFVSP